MGKPKVSVPGEDAGDQSQDDTATDAGAAVEPESPEQELARLRAENAALQAAAAERDKLPQAVYEPTTPHGKLAMMSSPTAGMTVEEVRPAIREKRLAPPTTSYLCADGYYARNDRD